MRRWQRPDRGVLFVVSGPSGVGKSTLVTAALAVVPDLSFSISATTRARREGERDGMHYHFLDDATFDEKLAADAFLEHAEVYGRRYGTLAAPTHAALAQGQSLLLDIDVQGARSVRAAFPESVHIMIAPPSVADLEARLRARGTDSEAIVANRMAQVAQQLGAVDAFDYVVVNDDLSTAHTVFQAVLIAEMSRVERRPGLVRSIHRELQARGHIVSLVRPTS